MHLRVITRILIRIRTRLVGWTCQDVTSIPTDAGPNRCGSNIAISERRSYRSGSGSIYITEIVREVVRDTGIRSRILELKDWCAIPRFSVELEVAADARVPGDLCGLTRPHGPEWVSVPDAAGFVGTISGAVVASCTVVGLRYVDRIAAAV